MALTNQEVKGSGARWDDAKYTNGQKLFIAAAQDQAPLIQSEFDTTDGGQTLETVLTDLRCTQVKSIPEVLPGLWLFTVTYRAFRAI